MKAEILSSPAASANSRISSNSDSAFLQRIPLKPTLGDRLSRLSLAGSAEGLSLRVFGSWMWQTLTGRSYVNRCSDLDLLAEVRTEAEADVTTAFLQREASIGTFNLDGELSVPGLGEVHWKEYLSKAPMLLLKSFSNVRLIQREELWK